MSGHWLDALNDSVQCRDIEDLKFAILSDVAAYVVAMS